MGLARPELQSEIIRAVPFLKIFTPQWTAT
jgi:hypothetical protein